MRVVALLVALGVIALLALGWLADTVGSGATMSMPMSQTTTTTATVEPLTRQAGAYLVTLTLAQAPLHAGQVEQARLSVTDLAGLPASARVACALSALAGAAPVSTATAQQVAAGLYTCAVTPPSAGPWKLRVTLTGADGASAGASFPLVAR